jgi:hypothetical protein
VDGRVPDYVLAMVLGSPLAGRIAALAAIEELTEAQGAAFWPIFHEYEDDITLLDRERLALIEAHANRVGDLTGGTADDLLMKALDLDSRRTALQQQFYATLRTVLSPQTAALALQIEHRIQFLIDLQLAVSFCSGVEPRPESEASRM